MPTKFMYRISIGIRGALAGALLVLAACGGGGGGGSTPAPPVLLNHRLRHRVPTSQMSMRHSRPSLMALRFRWHQLCVGRR